MQKRAIISSIILGAATMLAVPSYAQTPDGETPAEEGVCDVLQEPGTTKGLYGLCVAFCEAHDAASIDGPMTLDDLAVLEESAPSGKILTNYNKRKTDSDPAMPCVKVEEPCPCWTAEELDAIDGRRNDTGAQSRFFTCFVNYTDFVFDDASSISENDPIAGYNASNWAGAYDYSENIFNGDSQCIFSNTTPNSNTEFRRFSVSAGSLSETQFNACQAQIIEHIESTTCDRQN